MTGILCSMTDDPRTELGNKVRAARINQRFTVKAAAKAAGIARDTWVKIEAGESVNDIKRAAATQLLGLDLNGNPRERSVEPDLDPMAMLKQLRERLDEVERRLDGTG